MELYLVQHGVAKSEAEDPARPLSDRGRREVERVARATASAGLRVAAIAHSGKLRARETAEILAAALMPVRKVRELPGLNPLDDPAVAQQAVDQFTEPEMLVGHLPHLSHLASLLLVGDPAKEIVAFRMGGIVCLAREQEAWRVRWILTPEVVS